MSQPVSMGMYKVVSGTAAGTTVISTSPTNLVRIVAPANYTGTVSFYDCNTAAGSTASNAIFDFACTVGSIPKSMQVGISTHEGLVAVKGGTVNLVVVYE